MKAIHVTIVTSLITTVVVCAAMFALQERDQRKVIFIDNKKLVQARLRQLDDLAKSDSSMTVETAKYEGAAFVYKLSSLYQRYTQKGYLVLDGNSAFFVPADVDFTQRAAKELDLILEGEDDDGRNAKGK